MGLGSGIRIKPILDPGSRGKKTTGSLLGLVVPDSEKNERTLPKAAPEPPGWAGEDCACAGLAAGLLGWDPLTLQSKTITTYYYVICCVIFSTGTYRDFSSEVHCHYYFTEELPVLVSYLQLLNLKKKFGFSFLHSISI